MITEQELFRLIYSNAKSTLSKSPCGEGMKILLPRDAVNTSLVAPGIPAANTLGSSISIPFHKHLYGVIENLRKNELTA